MEPQKCACNTFLHLEKNHFENHFENKMGVGMYVFAPANCPLLLSLPPYFGFGAFALQTASDWRACATNDMACRRGAHEWRPSCCAWLLECMYMQGTGTRRGCRIKLERI